MGILQTALCPSSECPKQSKVSHKVFFQFLPLLTVCSYVDSLALDLPLQQMNENVIKWCNESSLCCHIFIYYLLHCLKKKRILRSCQIMQSAMENGLDSYWLPLGGLTEINLLCQQMEIVNADYKQKHKMIQFLIAFTAQSKTQQIYAQIAAAIGSLIEKVNVDEKAKQKYKKLLN